MFIKKSDKAFIDMHDRLHPHRWKTSNSISDTTKVGNVLITLLRFSISKIMPVGPDIQFINEDQPPPMYDPIIDLETLSEWKTTLNFYDETVTIHQPCRIADGITGKPR